MYFSCQDLDDGHIKRYWKHGRCWIGRFLHLEWCIPTSSFHFDFGINGGDCRDNLTFHFACWLFSIYISVKFHQFNVGRWAKCDKEKFFIYEEREFALSIHDGGIWLLPWGDTMGDWSRDMPWHKENHSFYPMDFLFGLKKYSEVMTEEGNCLIPMPEGSYNANYKLFVSNWKRPRLPFKDELMRISIDCPDGIPHEGKGENSYDCGEDASFGITCPARNLEEGIGYFVGSCLRDRRKYNHSNLHRGQKAVMAKLKDSKNEK
jgi:hypothetical protein